MSWFKFDDNAVDHPKLATLSDRGFRWWVRGLSYASRFLTDGVLHPIFWKGVPKQSRAELTCARLWDWDDPNFLIHDYLHHQLGKHEIEQDKERNREKAKAYRERRRDERRKAGALPVTEVGNVTDSVDGVVTDHIREHPTDNPTPNPTPNTQQREFKSAARSSRPPALIVSPLEFERKHGRHLSGFCDWVCFPIDLVERLEKRIPGSDDSLKREQITHWATDIRSKWETQIVPDGSDFEFWSNRWTETHGGSRPASATLKAAQAAKSIDEAFR